MKTLWLHRPLINWQEVYQWGEDTGIKKMMPPEELHLTLATCRTPVDWENLELQSDILTIPPGYKRIQIFGFTAKAIAFDHPSLRERLTELGEIFPTMDHAGVFRPHLTLLRGGKMPREGYEGSLVFGPEVAQEYNQEAARNIKHVNVKGYPNE